MEDPNRTQALSKQITDRPTVDLRDRAGRGSDRAHGRPWPEEGKNFGPYSVLNLLGRGGMGEVWEAESLETGHRLALKVLQAEFASEEDRLRFLQEGRLAASVSHPNSVYIYGTSDVGGHPVIAMELVPGGTLSQLVQERGPLAPARAVDLILDVIAGLQAAAAAGILHRDIKPGNCFVDALGRAKIGDFGLSLSKVRDPRINEEGGFVGTPAYASPEQVRCEALDLRSDLYSVGGTLYFLLSGRPPFQGGNVLSVLQDVLETAPDPPGRLRKGLPPDLERIVLRCLEKDRAGRFGDYEELSKALRPFSSEAPPVAPVVLRGLAFLADYLPWSLLEALLERFHPEQNTTPVEAVLFLASLLLYFGILEGAFGCSLGKRLLGLRVVGAAGGRPGWKAAFVRAGIWFLFLKVDVLLYLVGGSSWSSQHSTFASLLGILAMGLLFVPMRRRNGFLGLHELLSGTRTVLKMEAGTVLPTPSSLPGAPSAESRCLGPFLVQGTLREDQEATLVLARDSVLDREVWLREWPGNAPHLPEVLRRASRLSCLHWIQGRRRENENWDAYEAVPGFALAEVLDRGAAWGHVRTWLTDLAGELVARCADRTLSSRISAESIWIGQDGHARWLDFPAPSRVPAPEFPCGSFEEAQPFLAWILERSRRPTWPLHSAELLADLQAARFRTPEQLSARLEEDGKRPADLSWRRRLAHLAAPLVLPLIICIPALSYLPIPDFRPEEYLLAAGSLLEKLEQGRAASDLAGHEAELEKIAVYEYRRLKEAPGEPRSLNVRARSIYLEGNLWAPLQRRMEALAQRYPRISKLERDRSFAGVQSQMTTQLHVSLRNLSRAFALFFTCLAVLGLLSSTLFRGGAGFRVAGLAVVGPGGLAASFPRAFLRGAITWVFWLTCVAWLVVEERVFQGAAGQVIWSLRFLEHGYIWAGLSLLASGALYGALHPHRGLQDRLAGTWVVAR